MPVNTVYSEICSVMMKFNLIEVLFFTGLTVTRPLVPKVPKVAENLGSVSHDAHNSREISCFDVETRELRRLSLISPVNYL